MTFFLTNITYGQIKPDLKNSNLEGVSSKGEFYWWKNAANKGGDATFSVETTDVNKGSEKALKAEIHELGEKPWHINSQFNQKFEGKAGDEISIEFYAKNGANGKGKIKLVTQSDIKGSFQGKNIQLTNKWKSYKHTFTLKDNSSNNKIKFWYLNPGTTYYIDDLSLTK